MRNVVSTILNLRLAGKEASGQCSQVFKEGKDTFYVDARLISVNASKRFYEVSLNKEFSGKAKRALVHKGVIADNTESEAVLTALINYYGNLAN